MRAGYLKEWKKRNPDKMAGYSRKAREKTKGDPERYARQLGYTKKHRNKTAQEVKLEAFVAYGGPSCKCCGESIMTFLTLDHIDGGGNTMRRSNKLNGSTAVYKFLKKNGWPPGYQVLCFNCNVGRHINGGVCPHQTKGGEL
jgi:hypothetical protein